MINQMRIIYSTKVLTSNLWDYNNAYFLVRGNITINECNQATQGQVVFKNLASFLKCITKIDGIILMILKT